MTDSSIQQYTSEIFTFSFQNEPKIGCFSLTPNVTEELRNKISYHLGNSLQFTIIYHDSLFWVMGHPNIQAPVKSVWQDNLNAVCEKLKKDYGNHQYKIEWHPVKPPYQPIILSKLVAQLLRDKYPFKTINALTTNYIKVTRICEVQAEPLCLSEEEYPGIYFTAKTQVTSLYDLAIFYKEHPQKATPEFLVGLEVQEERGSVGTIIKLAGIVKDKKHEFLEQEDLKPKTKIAWEKAPDDELVVTIKYNRNIKQYDYPLSALSLYLDDTNCQILGIDYSKVYDAQKINCAKRQPLMKEFLESAQKFLVTYKINLNRDNVNEHYQSLFLSYPNKPFSQTQLLFGNGVTKVSNYVLQGLTEGKVYQRAIPDNKVIQIGILQLCDGNVNVFLNQLKDRLKTYGFASEISHHVKEILSGNHFQQRAIAEQRAVDLADETDLVIIFLPTYDRSHDEIEGGSLYHRLTQRLLRMQKPKQVIYQDTLTQNPKYVLNQVVPGIIAKLGNTPYILAKPLNIADCFIGLDVSRKPKTNLPGSMNACASVCVYGNQGQFIGYQVEPGIIEGEEIPANLLESCLSNPALRGKRILIYRDGLFRGDEIKHLVNWSSTQNSKLILVECRKSGNPRLYRWNAKSKTISPPPQALGMLLPRNQLILVTTEVRSEKIGLAKPLKLTVRPEGESADMGLLMHATLCLTLLHYGSLSKPRLPIPLYGADLLSYLSLQGVLTHNLYGNYQFW